MTGPRPGSGRGLVLNSSANSGAHRTELGPVQFSPNSSFPAGLPVSFGMIFTDTTSPLLLDMGFPPRTAESLGSPTVGRIRRVDVHADELG